ncbi:hypothetical protein [Streptomyces sp. ALB3]|uniref:hypothetical protein n=1 Tax=Streptomyces sp. ALB3 TaxID=3374278 RepID=UPI00378892B4
MPRPAHDPDHLFADHLRWLVGQLSARDGWLAVLAARRPEQLRGYLAGRETPPWDVVDLLLTDYERFRGSIPALRERTWALYTDVQRSEDTRHQPAPPSWQAHPQNLAGGERQTQAPSAADFGATGQHTVAGWTPQPAGEALKETTAPQPRRRTASAALAALAFGAAALPPDAPNTEGAPFPTGAPHPQLMAEARGIARHLRALRAAGASGQAHAVLSDAATVPRDLPLLTAALEEDGQGAEIATLLWEVASLPAIDLAQAVQALDDGRHQAHAEHLARLAAGRPPADVAELAGALLKSGHHALVGHLLWSVVKTRPRQDVVTVIATHPGLGATVLAAAQAVSGQHHQDLLYALRAAGVPGGH